MLDKIDLMNLVNYLLENKYDENFLKVYFFNDGCSANIFLYEDYNFAILFDLFSTIKNKCYGSNLVNEIINYCLDRNILLMVISEPFSDDGMNRKDLTNWYIKLGGSYIFDEVGSNNPVLFFWYDDIDLMN